MEMSKQFVVGTHTQNKGKKSALFHFIAQRSNLVATKGERTEKKIFE